jgi:hypothetical protein
MCFDKRQDGLRMVWVKHQPFDVFSDQALHLPRFTVSGIGQHPYTVNVVKLKLQDAVGVPVGAKPGRAIRITWRADRNHHVGNLVGWDSFCCMPAVDEDLHMFMVPSFLTTVHSYRVWDSDPRVTLRMKQPLCR